MDKELYGPKNLFTQFESDFEQQNFEEIKKLGESCLESQKQGFFINYVRRTPDYKMLDCIFDYYSFSDKLKADCPFFAIIFDNLPVFQTLFENYDFKQKWLLHCAFGCSADRIIGYLIGEEKGFEISDVKECYGTIVMAAKRGYSAEAVKVIGLFEKKGLKIFDYVKEKANDFPWRRLWEVGIEGRRIEFLQFLIAQGANANEVIDLENKLMPVHLAIRRRESKLLEFLAKKRAKLNFNEDGIREGFVSPLDMIINICCNPDDLDLHFLPEGMKILVQYGAEPKADIEAFVKGKIMGFEKRLWYDDLLEGNLTEEEVVKSAIDSLRKSIEERISSRNGCMCRWYFDKKKEGL